MDGRSSDPPQYPAYSQDKSSCHQIDPNVNQIKEPIHAGYYQPPPAGYPPSHDTSQNTVVYYQPMQTNAVTVTTVDNNMTCAILSCLFCFWPVGICAIVYACEVKPALYDNDINRASMFAEKSRRFAKISLLIGIIVYVISAILRIIVASV